MYPQPFSFKQFTYKISKWKQFLPKSSKWLWFLYTTLIHYTVQYGVGRSSWWLTCSFLQVPYNQMTCFIPYHQTRLWPQQRPLSPPNVTSSPVHRLRTCNSISSLSSTPDSQLGWINVFVCVSQQFIWVAMLLLSCYFNRLKWVGLNAVN